MSGSSGSSGYEYQARATAYVAAHILAQQRLSWIEHENADVPTAVAEETGGVGDDLRVTLQDGIQIELQAKHGLQKDKLWEPLIKLGHGLQKNHHLYGVLLTDSTASKTIREDLRNDLKRLGQGRTDRLKVITQEVQRKFTAANLPEADSDLFRRLVIVVLDLDEGLQDRKHAQLLLSKVLHNPNQSASSWKVLWGEGLNLISKRGYRDLKAWARLLSDQGIQLASACARENGMRSPEETEYINVITEKFKYWWKRSAFIDEINESTWCDFGLKVNAPIPSLIACAKEACASAKEEDSAIELVADKCGYRFEPKKFEQELIKECNLIGVTINCFEDFKKKKQDIPQKIVLPILDALQSVLYKQYKEKVLVVGKPGAGKSACLAQMLLISAENALQDLEAPIPVLIDLKSYAYQSNILQLTKAAFEKHNFLLGIQEHEKLSCIENLIKHGRLLLLIDCVNEASREAFNALKDFCDRDLPIIIATRGSNTGILGFQKKIEIQPLKPEEVQRFFSDRLPDQLHRVQELCNRVRDFGQTPLIVWMLYSIFRKIGRIPETRGVAYREFANIYAQEKGLDVYETRCQLGKLAFEIVYSEKPLYESQVQNLLGTTYQNFLDHHLLQLNDGSIGSRKIEFCHQTLQEYFAAEHLWPQVNELIKKQTDQKYSEFQLNYLNNLTWTEVISFMLGLPELENQAEKLVEMTLDVDLKLSARLAGEVKPNLQTNTVKIIADQKVPEWFRIFLLGETKSPKAIDVLMNIIQQSDPTIRRRVVWTSRQLDIKLVMPLIEEAIKDPDPGVRETTIRAVAESNIEQAVLLATQILPKESVASVREAAVVCALGKSESEAAILALLQATQDKENNVRAMATYNLKNMNRKILLPILSKTLKNKIIASDIRRSAARQLGELGDESITRDLFEAQLDLNPNISKEAAYDLQVVRSKLSKEDSELETHEEGGNKNQINYWLVYLKSEGPIPRGNAVLHLTSLLDKEVAVDLARQALNDPHHYVRGHAISSLVRLIEKEAIPQATRALDDLHYDVRDKASQALLDLRKDLSRNLEICEETVSNLIRILDEDQDVYAQSATVNTLTNLCLVQTSLLLRQDLEDAILNASNSSDNHLRQKAARALGQFNTEKSTRRLLQLMGDSVSHTVLTATEAIKNISHQITQRFLPDLTQLIFKSEEGFVLDAISSIQSRCGFYNYEIYQSSRSEASNTALQKQLNQGVTNVTNNFNFDQRGSTIGVNVASEGSNIKFIQHAKQNIHFSEQDLAEAAQKIQALLNQLAQTYPTTDEVQQQTFVQKFLEWVESTPDMIKVIFAGGIEGLKVLCPPAGIPVEMARRLYEAVQERHNQT